MKATDKGAFLRIFSAALLLFAVLGSVGCGKRYSHDEFNQLAMHKSQAEIKTALGEPAWINDGKPAMWIYHGKTFDAAKNKDDDKVSLTFAADAATGQERVIDIRFD